MHGLNPQLRQLAETLIDSNKIDQVIEAVKWAMVYGDDKNGASSRKHKNQNKKERRSGKGTPKGGKGSWGPSKGNGPKG